MTDSNVPPVAPFGTDLAPWARVLPSIDGPVASPVLTDDDRQRFQSIADERDRNLLASFRTVARLDPDVAGEAQRVAAKLGKPTKLVELDLDIARGVVLERQLRDLRLRESHPMVMQAIENPNFLRISYDDLENLVATDSVWQSMGRAWDAGRATNERGYIGSRIAMGLGTDKDRERLAELRDTIGNAQRDSGFLAGSAEVLGQMAGTTTTALAAGGAAAGLASLGGPISAGAAFTWTTGAAFFTQTAMIEGGNAYLDLMDTPGMNEDTAGAVALGVGLVNGVLELAGAKVVAKPFQGAVRNVGRRLTGGLAQETAGRAFASALGEYAKGLGAEVTTEVLQEIANITGEAIARPDGAPEPTWGEIRERLTGIAAKTFQGMALLGLPGPALHYFAQNRRAEAAVQRAEAFDKASQLAAASKVRQRNPDQHAAFAQRVAEEQGVQQVFVDAERFRQALEETGTTREELQAQLPDVFRQLEDAEANPEREADIVVPAGEWLSKVAQTKVGAALQPDVRFDRDAASRREADAYLQEQALFGREAREAVTKAEAEDLAFRDSSAKVKDSLQKAIAATGRLTDAKQVRGAAEYYAAFYETQARELGLLPGELFEQFPVAFEARSERRQGGDVLSQEEELRTDTPAFREWFGDSKVVDAEGRPLVVYHETEAEFTAFERGSPSNFRYGSAEESGGFFFYTETRGSEDAAVRRGARTIPVRLSIQNPAEIEVGLSLEQQAIRLQEAAAAGHDGARIGGQWVAFKSTQIKSVNNRGTWSPTDPNILRAPRGGFDPTRLSVLLYQKADFSTFVHEGAHFFLHVYGQLAQRGQASERQRADLEALLAWRGIDSIETWNAMSIDEQRSHHEAFAYSFEAHLFDGEQAPAGLQALFDRFKNWLRAVYRGIRDKIAANYRRETGEQDLPILTGEVRQVMDRMLASEEEVATAEAVRELVPLFQTKEQSGMSDDEWAEYQALDALQTAEALRRRDEDQLRQMRWLSGARSRLLKKMQGEHEGLRREVRKQVAAAVYRQPEFAVPRFIRTGELVEDDGRVVKVEDTGERRIRRADVLKLLGLERPADAGGRRVRGKSLAQFIRDNGGISWESWQKFPGEQSKEFRPHGIVRGRKGGGIAWDYMADAARAEGYGPQGISKEQDDYQWFIEAIGDAANGTHLYTAQDLAASGYASEELEAHQRSVAPPTEAEQEQLLRKKLRDEREVAARRRKLLAPFRGLLADDGVAIDVVAEAFGVSSGEALVEAIRTAPEVGAEIDRQTDERMLAEHSELADPAELEASIERALANDVRARQVAVELRHLERLQQPWRVQWAAAKEAARQAVARLRVADLRPRQFAMAEVRARRMAATAQRRGDDQAVVMWKRRELLQHAMVQVVGEAKQQIDQQMRQLGRFERSDDKIAKTRDTRLVNTARWILSRFGLASVGQEQTAQASIDAVRNYDPTMYALMEPLLLEAAQGSRDWREMTVAQMQELLAQVDGLWNQAKRTREIEIDGRREDKAEAIRRVLSKLLPRIKDQQGVRALSPKEKRARLFGSVRAALRHTESLALEWDGGEAGDVHRYLFAMLRDPFDTYQAEKNRMVKEVFDQVRQLRDLGGPKIEAPELGYVFESRAELLGALLHAGNEQNLRKNGVGRGWFERPTEEGERVDTSKWWRFVQRMIDKGVLTRADLDFAQRVWDTFEEQLKPQVQRAHFDNYGFFMQEVPSDAFTLTVAGERVNFRGGYFPAKGDPDWVAPQQGQVSVDGIADNGQAFLERHPSTAKGFTKSRVEVYRPLIQDVRLVAQAFDEELRFVHLQRPGRDIAAILNDAEVTEAIQRLDPNALQQTFLPWLQDTMNNRVMAPGGHPFLTRLLVTLRRNVGLATMFGNVPNALQQLTGLANSAAYVPRKFLRAAASRYASSPRETARAVIEGSTFMRLRLDDQVGQLVDDLKVLTAPSKLGTVQAWLQRNGYFLQRAMQNPVDVITWAGAHDQAIAEGKSEREAVRWADTTVRRSQGSGTAADISKAERAGALGRLFTQFATFWISQFNAINQQQTLRGKALLTLWLVGVNGVVAGAISQALRGGWDDEDDDGAYWDDVTAWAFGEVGSAGSATLVPIGGPMLYSLLTGNRGGRVSPGATWGAVERSGKALRSLFLDLPFDAERELRGQDVKDVATLFALVTGVPLPVVAKPVGYAVDVARGEVEPAGAVDAVRGAVTGVAAPGTR